MNPYTADLGNRDYASALVTTPARIRDLVTRMSPEDLGRSYAPGKWSAAQLILHLAQTELAFGTRLRMALSGTGDYVVQPFDQDRWLALDAGAEAHTALAVYDSLRALNLALIGSLSAEDLARPFMHPERGRMTVVDIPELLAGHELHHLAHFEAIASGR